MLFNNGPNKVFLVLDSCRATVLSADVTDARKARQRLAFSLRNVVSENLQIPKAKTEPFKKTFT